MLAAATRALRRAPLPTLDGWTTGRTGQGGQLVAALLVLTAFEAPAVHLVLHAKLGPGHALLQLAIGALHLYGVAWLVGDLRLVRESAHVLGPDALSLRQGARWRGEVPYAQLAAVELASPAARPDTLRLSGLDTPNVLLRLRAPVAIAGPFGISRRAARIALHLDEPAAFADALRARIGSADEDTGRDR